VNDFLLQATDEKIDFEDVLGTLESIFPPDEA
jgi:hypothetical protein